LFSGFIFWVKPLNQASFERPLPPGRPLGNPDKPVWAESHNQSWLSAFSFVGPSFWPLAKWTMADNGWGEKSLAYLCIN
jgi:hypothetical protein